MAKEACSLHGPWQSLRDHEGPSHEGKSMQRMAVDKDITESLSFLLPLEAAPPLDFVPDESSFSLLCKLV